MVSIKRRTALITAAGALALSVPAAAGAGVVLPGLGLGQASPQGVPVSSITSANIAGPLGPDGPLGAFGPLHGGGCVQSSVNPYSLGPNGPLGPHGPLGPGGVGANMTCPAPSGGLLPGLGFGLLP